MVLRWNAPKDDVKSDVLEQMLFLKDTYLADFRPWHALETSTDTFVPQPVITGHFSSEIMSSFVRNIRGTSRRFLARRLFLL